eukprot:INCI6519.1.p2 GENE.INCI6519.1~~INCI6519.1.p2  ORF type:complete len:100 (-),score=7.12 INCI6519.1:56-355(-)
MGECEHSHSVNGRQWAQLPAQWASTKRALQQLHPSHKTPNLKRAWSQMVKRGCLPLRQSTLRSEILVGQWEKFGVETTASRAGHMQKAEAVTLVVVGAV